MTFEDFESLVAHLCLAENPVAFWRVERHTSAINGSEATRGWYIVTDCCGCGTISFDCSTPEETIRLLKEYIAENRPAYVQEVAQAMGVA